MSVKVTLAPRYAVALWRTATAMLKYGPVDDRDSLVRAVQRLERAMDKHRVEFRL